LFFHSQFKDDESREVISHRTNAEEDSNVTDIIQEKND
jgi:hypothetical protein